MFFDVYLVHSYFRSTLVNATSLGKPARLTALVVTLGGLSSFCLYFAWHLPISLP